MTEAGRSGSKRLHDLAGELELLLELVLLEQVVVELRVLDGHADLAGDRGQEIEVFLVEAAAAVPRVDLDDPQRALLLIHDRHAHQRADAAVGNAVAVGEFGQARPC